MLFVSFKRMYVYKLIGAIHLKNKIDHVEERGDGCRSDSLEEVKGMGSRGHPGELALDNICDEEAAESASTDPGR